MPDREHGSDPIPTSPDVGDLDHGAYTPAAKAIQRRRQPGPGLVSWLPGMAYQCRNDPNWTMEFVSAGSDRLTGYAPHQMVGEAGVLFGDLIHPEDRERVWEEVQEALDRGVPFDIEYRIDTADGGRRWVRDVGRAIRSEAGELLGLEGYISDITERIELSSILRRSQKLEALGEFTGQVAHDFNNLLTGILAPLELALEELPDGATPREFVIEALEAGREAVTLTRQLLEFCRKRVPEWRTVDLNEVVLRQEPTLRRICGESCHLVVTTNPGPLPVRADPGHLAQVLVNLVLNAKDAMSGNGTVRIATLAASLHESPSPIDQVSPGNYAAVAVSDSGPGVSRESREAIFEPFFTTKAHGTGLGLASVRGIVTQHGGVVGVENRAEGGARFSVYLPWAQGAVEPLETPAPKIASSSERGSGVVLLVEDDDVVRSITRRALERAGYQVLEASDRDSALRKFERSEERVDVVITDVILAHTTGPRIVQELRAHAPGLPAVFASGFGSEDIADELEGISNHAFLEKPYSVPDLLGLVAEMIGTARRRAAGEEG